MQGPAIFGTALSAAMILLAVDRGVKPGKADALSSGGSDLNIRNAGKNKRLFGRCY